MISEHEIKDWWDRKVANYLQNYAQRKKLTIAQAKARFFTETHEKFVESVPQLLKKLLDEKSTRDCTPDEQMIFSSIEIRSSINLTTEMPKRSKQIDRR